MAASSMTGDGSSTDGPSRGALRLLAFGYFGVFAALFLFGLAVVFLGDPSANEPVVRLSLPPAAQNVATAPIPGTPLAPSGKPQPVPTPPPAAVPNNITQPVYSGRALVADPALIENSDHGPLPKIAADGTPPMRAYAAPALDNGKPRIAIVVSGLGISAKATAAALAALPPQVTLAFAPYASDVQRWVGEARREGHEVLLEVPMEPFDFPDSDPGPHTLRAGAGEDANTERLVWALTRFTGYTGVTNLLGGRFMSDPDSLEPVLTYLSRRGLLFYDNGAASHSAAPDVAARAGVAFAQSNTTIDSIQTAMEIDRELSDLENKARANGTASGAGFIYPVTIERVQQWAQGLPGRGFVLVPASAIVQPKK
ncbi:MAG: divergent polysaccharide deacetylase family protein [Alphaproteobacteria bacterium]|nr:divergent polysaccharide deacetylase family protein [Alphaproteobacteria bacterium]MBV9903262.1 divergent polysaccharide deacetylase family protein [Alphaproteobacteria bacterium]